MKRTLLSSAVAAALFATWFALACFTSSQASAQVPMTPTVGSTGGIALIDVNYIFKKHVRLRAALTDLQKEAEKVQKDFEEQLRRLQEEGQKLSAMKVGSPDYQVLEERLVSQKAMIQGRIALMRKEFVQKESHLYFNAYREITDEVYGYCQQHGIALVLNFDGDSINQDVPDAVARGITSKVVYYVKPLDITPQILPRFAPPQAANTNGGPNPIGVGIPR